MTLHDAIIDAIWANPLGVMTAAEIADALTAPLPAVQAALHTLDDEGRVMMRNGHYRLSESQKAEMRE